MEELLRTTDITVTAYVRAILIDAGIEPFELDVNMSVLEGSIGICRAGLWCVVTSLLRLET